MMKTRNSERSKITSQADRKEISMKKQKLCALLCAVFLMSCVHLDVWAESFNDEIAGIQYESIEELH